ncbi:MAG: Csu type fimbrial protein [Syntrophorhabdaceae bacterium]
MVRKVIILVSCILLALVYVDTVYAACHVTISAINFGSYDVFSTSPVDSVGSLTISCTNPGTGVFATVAISASPNSGSVSPRKMKRVGGGDLLNYNLFTTSSRTTVWGDGTAGSITVTTPSRVRQGRPVTINIYGRIPAGRDVTFGSYADTLVVTVTP